MTVSTRNETEHISEPTYIELIVCSPHQPVRRIGANINGHIKSLQTLWPNSPKKFIYNGIVLLPNKTFDEYGIKSGDSIVALTIEENDDSSSVNHWLFVTRDNETFSNQLKWLLNPKTVLEASRIRDLHLFKLENKPTLYRKFCQPFIKLNCESKTQQSTVTLPEQPTEPSTDELPILWN